MGTQGGRRNRGGLEYDDTQLNAKVSFSLFGPKIHEITCENVRTYGAMKTVQEHGELGVSVVNTSGLFIDMSRCRDWRSTLNTCKPDYRRLETYIWPIYRPHVVHTSVQPDVDHAHEIDGSSPNPPGVMAALSASTAFQQVISCSSRLL